MRLEGPAIVALRVVLLLGLAVGAYVVVSRLDLDRLGSVLAQADGGLLALAVLANLASQVTRALGWNALLPVRLPFQRLVRYELAAQTGSAVSPEGAGELVRVGLLKAEGVQPAVTVTLMAVRKLFSSLGLVPLLPLVAAGPVPRWAAAAAVSYTCALGLILLATLRTARPPTRPAGGSRWRQRLVEARTALAPVRCPGVLAEVGGAALLTRLIDLAAVLLVAKALDLRLSLATAVLVLLLVEVSGVLPAAPAQLGTFEVAVLLGTAGVLGSADAVALALVFHAQQILPQLPFGAMELAIRRGRGRRPAGHS